MRYALLWMLVGSALFAEAQTGSPEELHCFKQYRPVRVCGGGTMFSPNPWSDGFSSTVTLIDVKGDEHVLHRGSFSISSEAAGPIDPITGIDFEAVGSIDAIRTFSSHPNVVWCHGHTKHGSITFGTSPGYIPFSGTTVPLNPVNGEFIGAVTTWGRTSFVTVFEHGGPLPDFFNATEAELCSLVSGWSRILTPLGATPGAITLQLPKAPLDLIVAPKHSNASAD